MLVAGVNRIQAAAALKKTIGNVRHAIAMAQAR
jgi:hypothetical protein